MALRGSETSATRYRDLGVEVEPAGIAVHLGTTPSSILPTFGSLAADMSPALVQSADAGRAFVALRAGFARGP